MTYRIKSFATASDDLFIKAHDQSCIQLSILM